MNVLFEIVTQSTLCFRLSPRPSDTSNTTPQDLEKSSEPALKKTEELPERSEGNKVSSKFGYVDKKLGLKMSHL